MPRMISLGLGTLGRRPNPSGVPMPDSTDVVLKRFDTPDEVRETSDE
jgi:hypothetical protein